MKKMKRLTVWVDCEDEKLDSVRRKLEEYMRREKLSFSILTETEVSHEAKKK